MKAQSDKALWSGSPGCEWWGLERTLRSVAQNVRVVQDVDRFYLVIDCSEAFVGEIPGGTSSEKIRKRELS